MKSTATMLRVHCCLLGTATLLGSGAGLQSARAVEPAAPAATQAPRYTLYVGADVSVFWKGQLRPVEGVRGEALVVSVDGRRETLPARDPRLRLKVDNAVKLTSKEVSLEKVDIQRSYTAAADPGRRANEALMLAAGAAAMTDAAIARQSRLETTYSSELTQAATRDPQLGPMVYSVTQADLAQAAADMNANVQAQSSSLASVGEAMAREQSEFSDERYDALEVNFKVSSSKPLADAYLVVLATCREKEESARGSSTVVFTQALPHVGPEPRSVHVFRGGLPRGYVLEDCQLHIYAGGSELATNTAQSRMSMTADEALRYRTADYVAQNGKASRSATMALDFWPRDLAARVPAAKLAQKFYVRVSTEGRALGAFSDLDCTRPLSDADIEAVLPDLRFLPALAGGKPVEGVAIVKLAPDAR